MPRGISWSFNETEALIRLWADSTTQTALRLNSRNRCIYEDIANQLQAIGITRTADRMLKYYFLNLFSFHEYFRMSNAYKIIKKNVSTNK